jgi:phage-related protein (TIGR01555 family)
MTTFKERFRNALARVDSWVNVATGVGQALGRSGRGSYDWEPAGRIGDGLLEELYNSDPFAARICDAVPKHALRRGFSVKCGSTDLETKIGDAIRELQVTRVVREAWTWSRVFGGGAVLIGADDGRDASKPLDEVSLRRVLYLSAVHSRELWPEAWELDPLSKRFGEPTLYRLTRQGGGGASDYSLVHHTRLVRFEGLTTTRARRIALKGWGESYLQRTYDLLREWNGAHAAVADLLQQASIGVLKMNNLMEIVGGDDGSFKERMAAMDEARSVARSVLIDAQGESYERVEVGALSGIPDVIDRFSYRLAGALEIPVSILLGREPAGLNATGESDIRSWYDTLDADRETVLKPALQRVVRLLLVSQQGPTSAQVPEGWSIELPPLWEPSEKEKAELRKLVADSDDVYLRNGVARADEVARSRFRKEGWSMETEIDLDALEEPPASSPATQPTPEQEPDGAPDPTRSGMGGAGGPTKPAGLLPIPAMNTEGQK